jgi:hypothetical protein
MAFRLFDARIKEKEKEKALEESNRLVRTIMENLPLGIAVNTISPSVDFTYMNRNFLKFYDIEDVAYRDDFDFWTSVYEDEEFRNYIKNKVMNDCLTGDPDKMKWENIPISTNGNVHNTSRLKYIPVPNKDLMISLVWDVTEKVKIEEALKRVKLISELWPIRGKP